MILFLLLGIFVVGVLWELYYRHQWEKEITVGLWFAADAVYAGQTTKLYESIENRKRMPVPVLEVGFHTKKELDFADVENTNVSDYIYKRDIFAVLGMQKITREIPVRCTKRGRYAVSDADITAYTLFFRKRYSKGIGTSAQLYVYPKMTDVSDIMNVCERLIGTLQCAKRLYEDPFTFRTIRGYTTDDPMKSINWKASAKTGTLMVNTFDSVQSQKAMVFLDVEDTGILKYEALVEESIAIAAAVARRLLRQGLEVGFAYNGNASADAQTDIAVMPPTNKKSSLVKLERGLAEYNGEQGVQNFGGMLDGLFGGLFLREPLTEDTLLIFITKNLDRQLLRHIEGCAGTYQALVVVPVFRGEKTEAADMKSKDNIRILAKEVERA